MDMSSTKGPTETRSQPMNEPNTNENGIVEPRFLYWVENVLCFSAFAMYDFPVNKN